MTSKLKANFGAFSIFCSRDKRLCTCTVLGIVVCGALLATLHT